MGILCAKATPSCGADGRAISPAVPGELAISVPTLTGVTGPAQEEYIFDHLTNPVRVTLSYPAADTNSARIAVRAKWSDPTTTPNDLSFRFVDPLHIEITRPVGFDAGAQYIFTYTAKDPKVLGLGLAAARDVVSFLRNDRTATNPLVQRDRLPILRAYAFGASQKRARAARIPEPRFQRRPGRASGCLKACCRKFPAPDTPTPMCVLDNQA